MTILLSFIAANLLAASSGAFFKPGDWYESLAKPSWRPPNWLFAPAWMVLFLLNAYAGSKAYEAASSEALPTMLIVYGVSLAFNGAWSGLFFGLKRPDWALIDLIFLWLSIVVQIIVFASIDTEAAWLVVPYLAWVSFAGVLNLVMWRLNRERILARA